LKSSRGPEQKNRDLYRTLGVCNAHRNAREELNFGGPNFDIEDYSFVNIAAEYEINRHLSIFGRIDNLTNEHYAEVFGFPALGRAAYGGLKLRF
jgi:outer membrane cobalamin receptor